MTLHIPSHYEICNVSSDFATFRLIQRRHKFRKCSDICSWCDFCKINDECLLWQHWIQTSKQKQNPSRQPRQSCPLCQPIFAKSEMQISSKNSHIFKAFSKYLMQWLAFFGDLGYISLLYPIICKEFLWHLKTLAVIEPFSKNFCRFRSATVADAVGKLPNCRHSELFMNYF